MELRVLRALLTDRSGEARRREARHRQYVFVRTVIVMGLGGHRRVVGRGVHAQAPPAELQRGEAPRVLPPTRVRVVKVKWQMMPSEALK